MPKRNRRSVPSAAQQVKMMTAGMTKAAKEMAGWKLDDGQTKRSGGGPGSNAHRKARRFARAHGRRGK